MNALPGYPAGRFLWLNLTRKGYDLEVLTGEGQGVLVKNQLYSTPVVEFMVFGGQAYDAAQIVTLVGVPS